jgi:peptidoglycan biosynthesis protein MviN/MurJ (putative lipid II flippase)
VAAAAAPIVYNLAIIGAAILLAGLWDLQPGDRVVAGSVCHLGIQLLPLRQTGSADAPHRARRPVGARRSC